MTGRKSVPELPVVPEAVAALAACASSDRASHGPACVRAIAGPMIVAELRALAKLPDREKRGTFRDVLRARADAWEAGS